MDTSPENDISAKKREGLFIALLNILLDGVGWVISFFALSDDDRVKAGVFMGHEEHDQ